jgi:hypothetical protein
VKRRGCDAVADVASQPLALEQPSLRECVQVLDHSLSRDWELAGAIELRSRRRVGSASAPNTAAAESGATVQAAISAGP